jgi:hypothetical protein
MKKKWISCWSFSHIDARSSYWVWEVRNLQNSSIYFGYVMTSRVYYIGILTHKFSACIFLLLVTNSWHSKNNLNATVTRITVTPHVCFSTGLGWWVGAHSALGLLLQWRNSEYMEYQEQIKFRKCLLKFHSEYFIFRSTNADYNLLS